MEYAYIVFSSSTSANRLKRLAAREQIRHAVIVQAPTALSVRGCTYAIKTDLKTLPLLTALANDYGISYSAVYHELTDRRGRKAYHKL